MAIVLLPISIHPAVTYFSPRSQSVNVAREMVGWQQFINLCDTCDTYGAVSLTGEYSQTFRSCNIAKCLFGPDLHCDNDCGSCIKIAGSQVANRDGDAWLADYFGLPTDFQSVLFFRPRIQNVIADVNFYVGLSECLSGLYFRIHFPIVWTRWNLNFEETVVNRGVNGYPEGYFAGHLGEATEIPRNQLLNNAAEFFSGENVPNLFNQQDCIHPITFQPLKCARFDLNDCHCPKRSLTRLSDIEFALGWNFWCCEDDYLVGLSLRASAPTGNRPNGQFLFEPIVGSGGHWKLGLGVNAQANLWRSEDEECSLGLYFDARVQHLFRACQVRCFDLCGKPSSRYMLAQRLRPIDTTLGSAERLGGASNAGFEWAQEFAPVANLTSSNVNVDVAVEGDLAIKLGYATQNWEFDLGYNFWARSCEKICRRENCLPNAFDGRSWALKGDAFVVGFNDDDGDCVRLAATESKATINSGTNLDRPFTGENPNIDNRIPATAADGEDVVSDTGALTGEQTGSSNPIVFLKESDIDLSGNKGLSNKIFGNISYSWNDCEDWVPFIGFGGEVEFGSRDCNDNCDTSCGVGTSSTSCNTACNTSCNTSCNTGCNTSSSCSPCDTSNRCCQRCSLDQWGIWVKGGFAFN